MNLLNSPKAKANIAALVGFLLGAAQYVAVNAAATNGEVKLATGIISLLTPVASYLAVYQTPNK